MWYEGNYRRIFLDMHIDDWNEEFLSKLGDIEERVKLIKEAGAQQIVIKARPHTGVCLHPTKTARQHKGLKGRDYLGEGIALARKYDLAVMTYFSQIFDNYAYETHPEWRCINAQGKNSREYNDAKDPIMYRRARYGIVCPNNMEYREYVKAGLTELTENYDFDSIFLDMPFWPEICYCPSCRERYYKETGREMPRVINFDDPDFLDFQDRREKWIAEFTAFTAKCVKDVKPHVTIEHNLAVLSCQWQNATNELCVESTDYMSGDLYGGYLEQSFICKYYKNITPNMPFVFASSRCDPDLSYHTTPKTVTELMQHTVTALAHGGAFSMCDGVNPDGTICKRTYTDLVDKVFNVTKDYEQYVNGNIMSNAAIWFNSRSKFGYDDNGKPTDKSFLLNDPENTFIKGSVSVASIFRENNLPYDVINTKHLSDFKDELLVISNMFLIRDEEMDIIEKRVKEGKNLYISGHLGNKRMAELLGVEYEGLTDHDTTYMAPTEKGEVFFDGFDRQMPLTIKDRHHLVKIKDKDCDVLATLTLPYTMTDVREYSSIHSNPPGIHTDYPSVIRKKVGKGTIIWVAAPMESSRPYMTRMVAYSLMKSLTDEAHFTSNAASFIEILGWEKDGKTYFAALNQQERPPVAPMYETEITVPYDIKSARLLPGGEELTVIKKDGKSTIKLPVIEVFRFIEVTK